MLFICATIVWTNKTNIIYLESLMWRGIFSLLHTTTLNKLRRGGILLLLTITLGVTKMHFYCQLLKWNTIPSWLKLWIPNTTQNHHNLIQQSVNIVNNRYYSLSRNCGRVLHRYWAAFWYSWQCSCKGQVSCKCNCSWNGQVSCKCNCFRKIKVKKVVKSL